MERFELIAPCHFGLEAVLKREILDLGYEISQVEGRTCYILWRCRGRVQSQCIFENSRTDSD